ncbi:hypothetical protein [Sediminicoccus sp. KRV36]|uniref:hypothetical protein n=1 Tax=Sediminicoccus sp. KRV36 TaxID=3133721 RepID=UPI00200FB3E9|nr:hypothetical protein [Sediminicoccus rosea]UPY37627.1 hypothetical protein LHU95_02740 [Sediminicoccus rosea]
MRQILCIAACLTLALASQAQANWGSAITSHGMGVQGIPLPGALARQGVMTTE